ncbi:MAG: ribosome maturation factor RimM [Brevundimonas sp.]|jgi:16S rRNA processing protein RimM|uniref:ribosome maturation factor RimM n=1 Tax=Brevundimonas sp. TaxID=1871086 RepID=UPI00391A21B0
MTKPPSSQDAPADSGLVLVGHVMGAFGVRGEIRLKPYTEAADALLTYKTLRDRSGAVRLTLEGGRVVKGDLIGRAAEVQTREQAEALRGLKLHVPREALPPLDEDEFYLVDLIGLAVRTQDGKAMGTVRAVQNYGASDLIEVAPAGGGESWYLPFTREAVPTVNIAQGWIVAVPPAETGERETGEGGAS